MLKCEFCGREFSRNVINKHKERCDKRPKVKVEEVKKEDKKADKKKVK